MPLTFTYEEETWESSRDVKSNMSTISSRQGGMSSSSCAGLVMWHCNMVFMCSGVVVFCGLCDVNGGGDRWWLLAMGGTGCCGWWWMVAVGRKPLFARGMHRRLPAYGVGRGGGGKWGLIEIKIFMLLFYHLRPPEDGCYWFLWSERLSEGCVCL